MHIRGIIIAGFVLTLGAGGAEAGVACGASAPSIGTEVRGPVLHVADGKHLCVALGETPDKWLEVELPDSGLIRAASHADANPRGALMSVAFAQNVTCRILDRAGDRAVASCRLDGQPVGGLALKPQAISSGRAWR
jgi:hypothetical protein